MAGSDTSLRRPPPAAEFIIGSTWKRFRQRPPPPQPRRCQHHRHCTVATAPPPPRGMNTNPAIGAAGEAASGVNLATVAAPAPAPAEGERKKPATKRTAVAGGYEPVKKRARRKFSLRFEEMVLLVVRSAAAAAAWFQAAVPRTEHRTKGGVPGKNGHRGKGGGRRGRGLESSTSRGSLPRAPLRRGGTGQGQGLNRQGLQAARPLLRDSGSCTSCTSCRDRRGQASSKGRRGLT